MKLLIECEEMDEADEFARSLLDVDDQYLETWFVYVCALACSHLCLCVHMHTHTFARIGTFSH